MKRIHFKNHCSRIRDDLFEPAGAIHKLLCGAKGSLVRFPLAFDQTKVGTELTVKCLGIVPGHLKSTAFLGAIRREGGHDDNASGFDGLSDLAHVGSALLRLRQKMEYRTVMPYVIAVGR